MSHHKFHRKVLKVFKSVKNNFKNLNNFLADTNTENFEIIRICKENLTDCKCIQKQSKKLFYIFDVKLK